MSMIRWFKSLSIRNKIFMLVILGVIGVASISVFAKYSAIKKNTYMRVQQQSADNYRSSYASNHDGRGNIYKLAGFSAVVQPG